MRKRQGCLLSPLLASIVLGLWPVHCSREKDTKVSLIINKEIRLYFADGRMTCATNLIKSIQMLL
jgi:hypothetical protein